MFALGCSSGQEDPAVAISGAKETARAYLVAQQDGDWKTFCSLVSKPSQESLRTTLVQQEENGREPESCEDSMQGASNKTKAALETAAQGLRITDVKVDGDTATIYAEAGKRVASLGMVREGDAWRIALVR
jgi:hypothetical protein